MNNITDYNEFKNQRNPEVSVNEAAQLFDDSWKVRTRVEIPTSLINAYVKKVQSEIGEDPRRKWSEQELAEEITRYVTTAFMTIENLPSSIVSATEKQPTIQSQEDMPGETQIEGQIQDADQSQAQGQTQTQGQGQPQGQTQTQDQTQAPVQGQGQPQGQTQTPVQNIASEISQTQAPTQTQQQI